MKEKVFDNHVHFSSIRKNARNEDKAVKFNCCSVLLFFLFSSSDDRLVRLIVISSGSAIDTGYCYVDDYRFTAAVRVTNENIGSTVIIQFEVEKRFIGSRAIERPNERNNITTV